MNCGTYSISTFSPELKVQTLPNTNFIFLYDRSGSMANTIEALCEDLIFHVTQFKIGDTLTLGWFSGPDQSAIILKGFRISANTDHEFIARAIRSNNTTIGTTCFSESFISLKTTITDLQTIFSHNVVLCLFTDGFPVVSDLNREMKDLFDAIDCIKDDLSNTLLIGYSDSYNKSLLVSMAERLNGSVVHNSDLKETHQTLTEFIQTSVIPRYSISVPFQNILMACSTSQGHLYLYDPSQTNYSVIGDQLYVLHTNPTSEPIPPQAIYALATGLVQKAQSDRALELLDIIGDKYLMDRIINSFTNVEYGNAEHALMQAVTDESKRFREGKVTNYLPPENAFCLLDLLHLLMLDKEAKFYPSHSTFKYKRIGKAHTIKEGYPKFIPDRTIGVPISKLKWHKDKLNLSILVSIPGTVDLPDLGLDHYPSFQYRTYTLIKNGILNIDTLPITCSEPTLEILRTHNLIQETVEHPFILLNLRGVPVINKFLTKNRRSAKELSNKAIRALILESKLKVYNHQKRKEEQDEQEIDDIFLARGFRKDGSYAPPTVTDKSVTDYYLATVFKIKIKGCSTVPKVDAVKQKVISKRKLNFVETQMSQALSDLTHGDLDTLITEAKRELMEIRRYIQEVKFVLLLAKSWFEEFDQRTECILVSDYGLETTFEIGEEKVLID